MIIVIGFGTQKKLQDFEHIKSVCQLMCAEPVIFFKFDHYKAPYQYLDEAGEYRPVRCDNPCAPEALLELKHCGCRRIHGRCSTDICKCHKNKLSCTDLCKCGDLCKNRASETDDQYLVNDDDLDNI